MAFAIEASDAFKSDYRRLCKKNNPLKNATDSKIRQICEILETNPDHYKPLAAPLAGLRRVHIADSFVLIFEVMKKEKTIRLLRLDHHDDAYSWS